MQFTFFKRKKETSNIYSFYFVPEQKLIQLPGQYLYLTIPKLKDKRGPTRQFTISSPVNSKLVRITTSIKSASNYKKRLMMLKKNDIVESSNPQGEFVFDENETSDHVLLAGGIGITPFISFIHYDLDYKLSCKFFILHSLRTEKDVLFAKELYDLSQASNNIDYRITLTRSKPHNWTGNSGRIDEKMIRDCVGEINDKKFWICGSLQIVSDLEKIVRSMGTDRNNIQSEKFTGY